MLLSKKTYISEKLSASLSNYIINIEIDFNVYTN